MFPYRDDNPTEKYPIVTLLLIAANVYVWFAFQQLGMNEGAMAHMLCDFGLIPGEITSTAIGHVTPLTGQWSCVVDPQPSYLTLVSSQFLHGGWLHILGNMMFLWVFGNNIEDSMGHSRFFVFYILCGILAGVAQIASNPTSPLPMVGASGAVSGVLGAYLWLFPRAWVRVVVPILIYPWRFWLPAWTFLVYWAGIQLVNGLASLPVEGGVNPGTGGVAFWAHLGGFGAGLVLIHLFADERFLDGKPHRKNFRSWRR